MPTPAPSVKMPPSSPLHRVRELAQRAGLDWFLLGLIGVIGLAYLGPEFGSEAGPLPLGRIAHYGVSVIFFFYGLRLSREKLRAGLSNWRLHLVVQGTTFLLFPLLLLAVRPFFTSENGRLLWLGGFYLAALPSTVSSSVVMVSIARGNLPAAIFNASISSLLGVFITPVWMALFLSPGATGGLGATILDLALQVLLPVALGIVLHSRLHQIAQRFVGPLRALDQSIILLIVYTSFCESFAQGIFRGYSASDVGWLGAAMLALFFVVYACVLLLSRLVGFNRDDTITALFCGSKKSLVQGTVMSKVLFPDARMAGIILLPLMLYHALQILVASIVAQTLSQQADKEAQLSNGAA